MEYMTRHLIAIRELRHEGQHLQAGDRFEASDVDANYYLQTGQAHLPQAAPNVNTEATESTESAPKRRGRPPNSARVAAPEPVQAAEEPAAPAAQDPHAEQEAPAAESSSTEDAA